MFLIQFHHQSIKDNTSEMMLQVDMDSEEFKSFGWFVEEGKKVKPLPEGYRYMVCNQLSPDFVWASGKD